MSGAGPCAREDAEAIKDVQGLSPRFAGRCDVTGRVMCVAEVGQYGSFAVAIGQYTGNGEALLEVSDGILWVAELVMGVADVGQQCSLHVPGVDALLQGKCLLAVDECLVRVAEQHVYPADVGQRTSLPPAVSRGTGKSKDLVGVGKRLRQAALPLECPADVKVHHGLPQLVAEFLEQVQSLAEVNARLAGRACPVAGAAEAGMGPRLALGIALATRGGQRGLVRVCPVAPLSLPLEIVVHRAGKLPGVRAEPGGGGELDGRQQHRVLG